MEDNGTPEWVNSTPPDTKYFMAMEHDTEHEQEIEVSREEFVALKRHLAELRGVPFCGTEAKSELTEVAT